MSVRSRTIITTIYTIICDYCGKEETLYVDKLYERAIYNKRLAVRSLGWTCGRNDVIKCNTCR